MSHEAPVTPPSAEPPKKVHFRRTRALVQKIPLPKTRKGAFFGFLVIAGMLGRAPTAGELASPTAARDRIAQIRSAMGGGSGGVLVRDAAPSAALVASTTWGLRPAAAGLSGALPQPPVLTLRGRRGRGGGSWGRRWWFEGDSRCRRRGCLPESGRVQRPSWMSAGIKRAGDCFQGAR